MTPQEARELLRLHSFSHEDLEHPKMELGFLGSLHPFTGLNEENFREVMEAIRALAPDLQAEGGTDREIMSALWAICFQTWAIALQTGGALKRNDLISMQEIEKLEDWLFQIFFTVEFLLAGDDVETAFEGYSAEPETNRAQLSFDADIMEE